MFDYKKKKEANNLENTDNEIISSIISEFKNSNWLEVCDMEEGIFEDTIRDTHYIILP